MDKYILTQPNDVKQRFQTRGLVGEPQYNLRRETKVPTISVTPSGHWDTVMRFFGFTPSWAGKDKPPYFPVARSDKVHESAIFREAFFQSRCLVVADGWYIFGKGKQPYLLRLKSGGLFAVAAISSINRHFDPPLDTFAILSTEANYLIERVHERMPVILRVDDETPYLDPSMPIERVRRLLMPYEENELEMYKVGRQINTATDNSPEYIRPLAKPVSLTQQPVKQQPQAKPRRKKDTGQQSLF